MAHKDTQRQWKAPREIPLAPSTSLPQPLPCSGSILARNPDNYWGAEEDIASVRGSDCEHEASRMELMSPRLKPQDSGMIVSISGHIYVSISLTIRRFATRPTDGLKGPFNRRQQRLV